MPARPIWEARALEITIGDRFDGAASAFPDREALVSRHQQLRYTYRELKTEVDRFARGLLALGVRPRDPIGLWSPNTAEAVITQLAAAKVGALLVCVKPWSRGAGLGAVLSQCHISLLVFAPVCEPVDAVAALGVICPELSASPRGQLHSATLPALRSVVALGTRRPSGAYNWGDVGVLAEQVPPAALRARQAEQAAANPVVLLFPGGALSVRRGRTLSHQQLLTRAVTHRRAGTRLSSLDRLCLALPLSDVLGLAVGAIGCLTRGATLILASANSDPPSVLATIQEEACTAVLDTPRRGPRPAADAPHPTARPSVKPLAIRGRPVSSTGEGA
jgi:fatty-acyl-CoA synthase